jgi:L-aminopeptidase/D-esterase-like protein
VAGIDIRGGASGTEETHVLSPLHITDRIHAVLFSGGSAFGLEGMTSESVNLTYVPRAKWAKWPHLRLRAARFRKAR